MNNTSISQCKDMLSVYLLHESAKSAISIHLFDNLVVIFRENAKLEAKYLQTKSKYLYLLQEMKQPVRGIERLNSKCFKNCS